MDALTVNNINPQLPEIQHIEPDVLNTIAQQSLDQMYDFFAERAFGFQKRLRPINEAEVSIAFSLSHRLNHIERSHSILEKIPLSERQLVAAWLEKDQSHLQLLLGLNDKDQLPLTLILDDEKFSLTHYETLLLTQESETVKLITQDWDGAEIPLTHISPDTIRCLISCLRGGMDFRLPSEELSYAISHLEISSLESILIQMIQTMFNQALNIDEIEAVVTKYPDTWYLVPRQELGDILHSKIRFCHNADDFGRLLKICSFWNICNMTDRSIELIPTITLPKEADAGWLEKMADYRGGLDFIDCKHLVLEPQAWQHLSKITFLDIALPLFKVPDAIWDMPEEQRKIQQALYTDSFCQALVHLVNLEKFDLNHRAVRGEESMEVDKSENLKFIPILAALPKMTSAHSPGRPCNSDIRLPLKGLKSYGIDHIESLPQILDESPLLESLKMDRCEDAIMEKLLTLNQLEHLHARFDIYQERKVWKFDQLLLNSLSCDIPENQYTKFVDQISRITSLTKLELFFYYSKGRGKTGEVTENTFNPLSNLTNLQELSLHGDSFKVTQVDDALQFIAALTNLKSLTLGFSVAGQCLGYLANKANLEELSFEGFGGEDSNPEFLRELEGVRNLKKLVISNTSRQSKEIQDEHIEFLAGKPIIELKLTSSELTNASAETIKQLTSLRILKMTSAKVSGQFIQTIAGHLPLLNDLHFAGDPQDAGWEALSVFPNLQRLEFKDKFFTQKTFTELLKIKTLREFITNRTDPFNITSEFSAGRKLLLERQIDLKFSWGGHIIGR